ncbi:Gfo/Idh/MocA family protein [Emcibacter sp.]|uniref:Gfo/Idh/MocA family protein n=1 Tax=Emcibacter sp. TaxID=1979954 RepID=UPI003A936FBA
MNSSRDAIKVFIIGCGAIAGGYDEHDPEGPDVIQTHAKAFSLDRRFRIIGSYDADKDRARRFARTWKIEHVADEIEMALTQLKPDVVCLCSPTKYHARQLELLQDRGIRLVLCEKPLTDSIESSREVAEAYSKGSTVLTVNYTRRWNSAFQDLARRIAAGEFGGLQRGAGWYNKGLYNNGSHMVDLFRMFFGELSVNHAGNVMHDFWDGDPTLNAGLRTANGLPLHLAGTDVRHFQFFECRLIMEKAVIDMADFGDRLIIRKLGDEGMPVRKAETIDTGREKTFLKLADNIAEFFIEGAPLKITAGEALRTLEVCAAIRQKAGVPA